ncbi:hypothetical protein F751_5480 [Auxenochlorella protothecoides]|uniref:Staygreen protein domain-containing protein n=1 Tax=Auxenochlorella protothecoides TaxID=3075 RepID=A0A087STS0_AUXPR|nr:hypothetical protein F751_5480 [Auxenochlorella protothecoides]KFM29124.1 hypothetical protein F751_5480 [Auxenochlorella protothecoides]
MLGVCEGLGGLCAVGLRSTRSPRPALAMRPQAALFSTVLFSPSKLRVALAPDMRASRPHPDFPSRKYTLTHNDITGNLFLSIGPCYNQRQLSRLYTRLLRDEVLAEWLPHGGDLHAVAGPGTAQPRQAMSLHVHCHVSGGTAWTWAPPGLRSAIFRREMGVVLAALAWAERDLLSTCPAAAQAHVVVHLHSHQQAHDRTLAWGRLGDPSSWPTMEGKGLTALLRVLLPAMQDRAREESERAGGQGSFPSSPHTPGEPAGQGPADAAQPGSAEPAARTQQAEDLVVVESATLELRRPPPDRDPDDCVEELCIVPLPAHELKRSASEVVAR